ncbi:hypothetical protein QAD02_004992 [Eretmocerus hayati]|uniref:Uncharacterized protein n=1 Tax=Eretmocerus hayati TaxID=131215 RepID=A0ACC2NRA1_9HYME|nr:hypothetical protein QAD02_004992 [Eretmocerus hayati]
MVQDLKQRLDSVRLPQPALENVGWSYGVRSEYIRSIIDYWKKDYKFEQREDKLNKYPQFITKIQGLDIHYYHVKPQIPEHRQVQVLPLMMLHGWPSSVVEFQKIIPLLNQPRSEYDFAFEMIIPSLPGFGYSDATTKQGLDAPAMAEILKNLMMRLKKPKFYVLAGDWGAWIASSMAIMYPNVILGLHSTMCTRLTPETYGQQFSLNPWNDKSITKWLFPTTEGPRDKTPSLQDYLSSVIEESGYFHEQATKPDTIGFALSDSPAGLAAYILEKFAIATNKLNKYTNDGNITKLGLDNLIDNLMLYWIPNKITSSMRIYAESANRYSSSFQMEKMKVKVPTSCVQAPNEIIDIPKEDLCKRFVQMKNYQRLSKGGHFLALEEPTLYAHEIWRGIGRIRNGTSAC